MPEIVSDLRVRLSGLQFVGNGYIYINFIVITTRGIKSFPPNFPVRARFPLANSFCRFPGESPGRLRELYVYEESTNKEIGWKSLCFAL